MAAPTIRVFVDFNSDTYFETNPLVLGSATQGILGTNKLGTGVLPVEITSIVTNIAIRRGRNRITGKFEAGLANVTLNDTAGNWNPLNASSPYYPNLVPLKQIIIYASYAGYDYYLFSGFIQSYDTSFATQSNDLSQVVLQCIDGFKLLAGAAISTVAGATAGQLSGARANKILDAVSFPASLRQIDSGDSTLQADPATTRNVLDALQTVENSEFGGFFFSGDGYFNFKSRTNLIKAVGNTAYTFSDAGGGIGFQDAALAYDDTVLLNQVTVTRLGGSAQSVLDQTSIDNFFLHSGIRENILVQTDAEALDQARGILATRKDPEPRIDSITLNLYDDINPLKPKAGLDIDLLDGVQITKKMPGGSTFTQKSLVYGVHYDITVKSFVATLFTSEPLLAGFVLDSSVSGIIGTDVLSY